MVKNRKNVIFRIIIMQQNVKRKEYEKKNL